MYKLTFYIPVEHADTVKDALFAAGAGKIGNYACCAWQVLGEGQFLPLAGSNPQKGEPNILEKSAEYKVEMVVADQFIKAVVAQLRKVHPYEEPAYQVLKVEDI
jgi:hypothetical protein